MCNEAAATTSAARCPAVNPFTKAFCVGGCCYSSGKCISSSCALSGVGKEVPNTICYGLNAAGQVGASPQCAGLACKLAVPGCTTDLLGGACVGTVVDVSGTAFVSNPGGAAMVGYPCLDVTASGAPLTAAGAASASGAYVAKLWSVCDCHAAAIVGDTAAAGPAAPSSSGSGLLGLPSLGQLNVTSVSSLVGGVIGAANSSTPMRSVLDAVKAQVPSLIVPPKLPAANLTSALAFLGNLISKADER